MFQCYISMSYSIKLDLTVVAQEFDYPFQPDIKYNLSFPCNSTWRLFYLIKSAIEVDDSFSPRIYAECNLN